MINKERENPVDIINGWYNDSSASNIVFNPNLKTNKYIVKQMVSDGTMLFTYQLIESAILPLRNETEKETEAGWIWISTVFGDFDLPAGRYPGQRQRVRIPVIFK